MFDSNDNDRCRGEDYIRPATKGVKDLGVQLVLSLVLGTSALIAFCVCPP